MKKLIVTVILIVCAVALLPLGSVFAAEPAASDSPLVYGNVYVEDNSYVKLEFNRNASLGAVLITANRVNGDVDMEKFGNQFTLKTKSGKDVAFIYKAIDKDTATINFSLTEEDVYLKLIASEFENLSKPIFLAPVITAPYNVKVTDENFKKVAQYTESGDILLTLIGLESNAKIISDSAGGFTDFTVTQQYHMNLSITRNKNAIVSAVHFAEDTTLNVRFQLPNYNEKYQYALLEQLDARGVRITKLTVDAVNGMHYVTLPLAQNGDFSVVGYKREELLPWWGILLICLGGLILIGSGGLFFGLKRKKQNAGKEKAKQKDKTGSKTTADASKKPPETSDGAEQSPRSGAQRVTKPKRTSTATATDDNPKSETDAPPSPTAKRAPDNLRKQYQKTVKKQTKKKK